MVRCFATQVTVPRSTNNRTSTEIKIGSYSIFQCLHWRNWAITFYIWVGITFPAKVWGLEIQHIASSPLNTYRDDRAFGRSASACGIRFQGTADLIFND